MRRGLSIAGALSLVGCGLLASSDLIGDPNVVDGGHVPDDVGIGTTDSGNVGTDASDARPASDASDASCSLPTFDAGAEPVEIVDSLGQPPEISADVIQAFDVRDRRIAWLSHLTAQNTSLRSCVLDCAGACTTVDVVLPDPPDAATSYDRFAMTKTYAFVPMGNVLLRVEYSTKQVTTLGTFPSRIVGLTANETSVYVWTDEFFAMNASGGDAGYFGKTGQDASTPDIRAIKRNAAASSDYVAWIGTTGPSASNFVMLQPVAGGAAVRKPAILGFIDWIAMADKGNRGFGATSFFGSVGILRIPEHTGLPLFAVVDGGSATLQAGSVGPDGTLYWAQGAPAIVFKCNPESCSPGIVSANAKLAAARYMATTSDGLYVSTKQRLFRMNVGP